MDKYIQSLDINENQKQILLECNTESLIETIIVMSLNTKKVLSLLRRMRDHTYAIMYGAIRQKNALYIFTWLIKYEFDLSVKNSHNNNIYHIICLCPGPDTLKILKLIHSHDQYKPLLFMKNKMEDTPFHHVTMAKKNETCVISYLIDQGCNINQGGCQFYFPIHHAIWNYKFNGNLDIIKLLLEKGANVNECSKKVSSPLFYAIKYISHDIVLIKLLLEMNASFNKLNDEDPVLLAFEYGIVDVIHLFIQYGANVQNNHFENKTPLSISIKNGNIQLIELLLNEKVNVFDKDKHGKNYLSLMENKFGHEKCIELLGYDPYVTFK